MNTINYQPTGIYSNIFNSSNNSYSKKSEENLSALNYADNKNNKENKNGKMLKLLGIAGIAAGLIYYKKGVGLIEKKAEFLKEKRVQSFDEWKNLLKPNEEEANSVKEMFDKATAHENGIVGKVHSGLSHVRKFLQDNFYTYGK